MIIYELMSNKSLDFFIFGKALENICCDYLFNANSFFKTMLQDNNIEAS